jgi:hypothetical protein
MLVHNIHWEHHPQKLERSLRTTPGIRMPKFRHNQKFKICQILPQKLLRTGLTTLRFQNSRSMQLVRILFIFNFIIMIIFIIIIIIIIIITTTTTEDRFIAEAVKSVGKKWTVIANQLGVGCTGLAALAVEMRWKRLCELKSPLTEGNPSTPNFRPSAPFNKPFTAPRAHAALQRPCTAALASHVTRHTSHVTRHTSHVTRHTSHVTRHTSRFPSPLQVPFA